MASPSELTRRELLGVAAAGVAAVAGCSPGQATSPGSPTGAVVRARLQLWTDRVRAEPLARLTETFQAERGVEVDIVAKEPDQITGDFLAQVVEGTGPDLVLVGHDRIAELVTAGLLAPVNLDDLGDVLLPVASQAFEHQGENYGLPVGLENIALLRNDDLTGARPGVWDELLAEHLDMPVALPQSANGDPYHAYPFQASFGAPLLAGYADGAPELGLGGAPGAQFATWLQDHGDLGSGALSLAMTEEAAMQAFVAGTVPFLVAGPWRLAELSQTDIRLSSLPLPTAGGQPPTAFVGVHGAVVSAESANQDLAQEFLIEYLASDGAQLALHSATGRSPALRNASELLGAEDAVAAGFTQVAASGVSLPSRQIMAALMPPWGQTQADLVTGAASDPGAAWVTMVARMEHALLADTV
ncbi:MAG: extracellular solute-binding protein [Beutenbergiaceae bacterium]